MSQPYTSTIVITGGTAGLGYETTLSLARRPDSQDTRIVICSRTGGEAADAINKLTGRSNVVYIPLDLSSQAKTRAFVDTYKAKGFPPIKALVLNAGVQMVDKVRMTEDGVELNMAINVINTGLLFFLLKDHLTATAHIVQISSVAHDPARGPPLRKDGSLPSIEAMARPPPTFKPNGAVEAVLPYAWSKLCNVLLTYALHRHASSK